MGPTRQRDVDYGLSRQIQRGIKRPKYKKKAPVIRGSVSEEGDGGGRKQELRVGGVAGNPLSDRGMGRPSVPRTWGRSPE